MLFKLRKGRISSFHWVLISFLLLIMIGTFLLTLPVSSAEKHYTPFLDCLFTATSASCVTGLIVKDTATYWSAFGKLVIIILIQIGGLGVVTMTIALVKISGRKISLYQRSVTQESLSAEHGGGIIRYVYFMIKATMAIELAGALFLSFAFVPQFGLGKGLAYALFHAISAFCNAGFDLMGHFTSLTSFAGDAYVNIVIMALIIFGGLGFATWSDFLKHRLRFREYSLQSKVIISTSLFLIFVPALFFYLFEYTSLPFKERLLGSLFQSVTCRTAGFNTTDQGALSPSASLVCMLLMMIGGSPGSTAGGMKTTTIAVLVYSSLSVFTQTENTTAFRRRIADSAVKGASAIFMLYMFLFIFSAIVICGIENLPLLDCLYEIASAIGTVGLTRGITPMLHLPTKLILIFLMFFGRVGCLTLIYALLPRVRQTSKVPLEHINIG